MPTPTAPLVAAKVVDEMLGAAVASKASDIHIEPNGEQLRVRYRVDGILRPAPPFSRPLVGEMAKAVLNRLKVMASLDHAEHRLPQDGRFSFEIIGKDGEKKPPVDVRLSSLPLVNGEKIELRLLNALPKMAVGELFFSPQNERLFRLLCQKTAGLLLAVGPTGSGKTTTLYAALSELDAERRNVVTVEDPVECTIDGVNQIAADEKELTFPRALRAILRQDPDVVLVGEIRDEETAQTAVQAALIGRLIISTLHTANALQAVTRLVEMGVKPYLLAGTLNGILAQRLVRRLCPHCREKYEIVPDSPDAVFLRTVQNEYGIGAAKDFADGENLTGGGNSFYRPPAKPDANCPACRGEGYAGRLAIHEILAVNAEIAAAIGKNSADDLKEAVKNPAAGFVPFAVDGIRKAKRGLTSLFEVSRAVYGIYG